MIIPWSPSSAADHIAAQTWKDPWGPGPVTARSSAGRVPTARNRLFIDRNQENPLKSNKTLLEPLRTVQRGTFRAVNSALQ